MVGIGGHAGRWRQTPLRIGACVAAALPLLLCAQTSSAAGTGDEAATRAFLQADYQLYSAALKRSGAAKAAARAFATRLSSECAGVLAGEPKEEVLSLAESEPPP